MTDRHGGGKHRLLKGQGDLAVTRLRPPQAFVDLLQFTGTGEELGLQHAGASVVAEAAASG